MTVRTTLALALLVRDGRVLLVHRNGTRSHYPDCWDLAGGHVENGEAPREAVVRECLEELGVRVHEPVPIPMTVADPDLEVHAFLVTRWDGEPVNAAPEEHDELRWIGAADVAALELAHPSALPSILGAVELAAVTSWGAASDPTTGEAPSGVRGSP